MTISAAKKLASRREASSGTMETLARMGRAVPLGAGGMAWAVRTEVFSWMTKRMSSMRGISMRI